MHFEEVDRLPWWEMWYWGETLERWYEEGLPRDVDLRQYFGVDRKEWVPIRSVNRTLLPQFEQETLEETDAFRIFRDEDGITKKVFKEGDGQTSMPHWIDFPLKDRKTWEEFKARLDPDSPERYPADWEERKKTWKMRDYPLIIDCGSIYGRLRNWIGLENFSIMFYEEPALVHEMMDYMGDFFAKVITRAVIEVDIDIGLFWEDMSCKTGSLLSPKMFREFMIPNYLKITEVLRSNGIDVIFVDSDGNIDELIPLWLECGVNGFLPLEVAGGMDPVKLRKQYGEEVLLIGGIDKRAMAANKEAIDVELESKLPLLCKTGGYVPWCDHLVPPDVSFENYMYYLNKMKQITRNPDASR
jgi:uroporphyrinogen decarboxylase